MSNYHFTSTIEWEMESLERELNKKQFRLVGITEEKNEAREQLKAKVATFITATLLITATIGFDNLYRMG
jgi:hypothetical protein